MDFRIGSLKKGLRMTLRIEDGFNDDELPERYIAALLVIADFHNISVDEAHSGISDMLEEMEVDVQLDKDRDKVQTRH